MIMMMRRWRATTLPPTLEPYPFETEVSIDDVTNEPNDPVLENEPALFNEHVSGATADDSHVVPNLVGVDTGNDFTTLIDKTGRLYIMQDDPQLADELMASEYSRLQFNCEVAASTIKQLKILKHQSKRSSVKLQELSKLCFLLFNKKTSDVGLPP